MNFYYKNSTTWALLKHSISYKNIFYLLRSFYFVRINILNQHSIAIDMISFGVTKTYRVTKHIN